MDQMPPGLDGAFGRNPPPLATENLLENTDWVLHQCVLGAAACYLLFMLTAALLIGIGGYTEARGPGVGFGLGLSVDSRPELISFMTSRGTFGWAGAASTVFWVRTSTPHGGAALGTASRRMHSTRAADGVHCTVLSCELV